MASVAGSGAASSDTGTPGAAHRRSAADVDDGGSAPDAASVRVMDLGSLSAADSSANLNIRRRSHTRNSTASYVTAWQSQQVLDNLSKKIISSVSTSAASSPRVPTPRDPRVRAQAAPPSTPAASTPAASPVPAASPAPSASVPTTASTAAAADAVSASNPSSPRSFTLRDFHSRTSTAVPIPGFPSTNRMALKLAGTAERDSITRTAMSAFQRWRRLPLLRGARQPNASLPTHPRRGDAVSPAGTTATVGAGTMSSDWPTMKESTVSSLFTSSAGGPSLPSGRQAPDPAPVPAPAPRLPSWQDPTRVDDTSPLGAADQKPPPAKASRIPAPASGTGMAGTSQRRVTPRGAVLLNSYSDNSEQPDDQGRTSSLAALTHNTSGDPSTHDRAPSGNADSGMLSPTQPIISLLSVHSRRATPSKPFATASQTSRSCSARSGPSLAVGEDPGDDFQRRWEEEGLSMSDRIEDLLSIEEDHRHSISDKEQRRRTRLLARYTRASDAIFMDALRVSTSSRPYPSLTSSAANPSLEVEDTPSDDNLSFWVSVSLGVGYNHGAANISGSSFAGGGSGSEVAFSAPSPGGGAIGASAGAGAGAAAAAGGQATHAMAVPQVVSQRGTQAPLPLAPTPRHSPRLPATAEGHSARAEPVSTRPLDDSMAPDETARPSASGPVMRTHRHASSEANVCDSEDGLEDVTLSAVTISCNNSLNSTRNNGAVAAIAAVAAGGAASQTSPPTSSVGTAPGTTAESHTRRASVTSMPTSLSRRVVQQQPPPPSSSSTMPPHAQSADAEDEVSGTSGATTTRTTSTVTTKQPPRSMPPSLAARRVRPVVEKPQTEARQELEEAVKLGEEADAEVPSREAERAVERSAKAVQDQQRRFLREVHVTPMVPEACATGVAPAAASTTTTPVATSVVARRRRSSALTLDRGDDDAISPALLMTPGSSRRASAATSSPSSAAAATASTTPQLNRDTYQDLVRGPEKEARHQIIINYRAGLLEILKACNFMSS